MADAGAVGMGESSRRQPPAARCQSVPAGSLLRQVHFPQERLVASVAFEFLERGIELDGCPPDALSAGSTYQW